MSDNPLNDKIRVMLEDMVSGHGFEPTRHEGQADWVLIDGDLPAFHLHWAGASLESPTASLNVAIQLDPQTRLTEMFAALGDNLDDAIADGLQNFASTTLHPVLGMIFEGAAEGEYIKERWHDAGGRMFEAFIGDERQRFSEGAQAEIPADFSAAVHAAFARGTHAPGLHWMSVYCSRAKDQEMSCSAILDGVEWADGAEALARLNWPQTEGFYGVRLFACVRPVIA